MSDNVNSLITNIELGKMLWQNWNRLKIFVCHTNN